MRIKYIHKKIVRKIIDVINVCLLKLPTPVYQFIINFLSKLSGIPIINRHLDGLKDRIGYKEYREYAQYLVNNFESEVQRVKREQKYVNLTLSTDRGYFGATNIVYVLENVLGAFYIGAVPIIQVKYKEGFESDDDCFQWEWYFEPICKKIFGMSKEEIYSDFEEVANSLVRTPFKVDARMVWKGKGRDLQIWRQLYSKIIELNKDMRTYVENDKKVNSIHPDIALGVFIRGTDYIKLKPVNHPVQPKLKEIIEKISEVLEKQEYKEIYVTTDEIVSFKKIRETFNDRIVLENSRTYYDKLYKNVDAEKIHDVRMERERDNYWRGIEYLSSLTILSQCRSIVGGLATGSGVVMIMSDCWDEVHIFNKGLY